MEEVGRQGHNTLTLDGIERVGWMIDGWSYAIRSNNIKPTVSDLEQLGKLVERHANQYGFRTCEVMVGGHVCPRADSVPRLVVMLFESIDNYEPIDFYKALLNIHPFQDGNGRSGKIILNWLNRHLVVDPIFPPSNLWGREIRNP